MTYYLCEWHDGSDANHTIINHGQEAVWAWLRDCLGEVSIGCPEEIVDKMENLDAFAGKGAGQPVSISFIGADHAYAVTEITDLGALGQPTGDKVVSEVRERLVDAHRIVNEALVALDMI